MHEFLTISGSYYGCLVQIKITVIKIRVKDLEITWFKCLPLKAHLNSSPFKLLIPINWLCLIEKHLASLAKLVCCDNHLLNHKSLHPHSNKLLSIPLYLKKKIILLTKMLDLIKITN